jgi:hypothetical protein
MRLSRSLILRGPALLGFVCILLSSGCSDGERASQQVCNAGSQANAAIQRFPAGANVEVAGPVTVLDCGQTLTGKSIELVNYQTSNGECFAIDMPGQAISLASTCTASNQVRPLSCRNRRLCITSVDFRSNGDNGGETLVSGFVTPKAEKVHAVSEVGAHRSDQDALLGKVLSNGKGMAVRREEIGYYFAAFLRGCVASKRMIIVAEDSKKRIVATIRGGGAVVDQCQAVRDRRQEEGGEKRRGSIRVTPVEG